MGKLNKRKSEKATSVRVIKCFYLDEENNKYRRAGCNISVAGKEAIELTNAQAFDLWLKLDEFINGKSTAPF